MKNLLKVCCFVAAFFSVANASFFSSTIRPSQLVGSYQCHGDDAYYHTKYVGSFTLIPDEKNNDILVYQARYNNLDAHQQVVKGLAYIDKDALILAFKPNGDIPQGVGSYRVLSDGKFLKGKFIYLTDPDTAKLNRESCERVEN
jgi:hypothetical protein